MELADVVEATGLPLGLAVAAANISEQACFLPPPDHFPLRAPESTPVMADKGYEISCNLVPDGDRIGLDYVARGV